MTKVTSPSPLQSVERLSVLLDFYKQHIEVGTLAWSKDERRTYFEYHPDFAAKLNKRGAPQ
jgi:serine/threonine-protein kinase HipA